MLEGGPPLSITIASLAGYVSSPSRRAHKAISSLRLIETSIVRVSAPSSMADWITFEDDGAAAFVRSEDGRPRHCG